MRSLPEELLPTFWFEDERELLGGTTLKPAVEAKLRSLSKEFDALRSLTQDVPWCAKYWWLDDEEGDYLIRRVTLDDWMAVDAMYRSRALEFPGIGDAMVPCIDMCNHAADEATSALYETDANGNAVLLLRDGKNLKKGEEITITYGDKKGACEMIFSYGFLENRMASAKELFLDLQVPDDDPLGMAKAHVSTSAPGVRLFDDGNGASWESAFVYILCVNEEDGLGFGVLQTTDGGRELKTRWKDQDLADASTLRDLLEKDPMWEVFQLRAVTLISGRVEAQLQQLEDSKEYDEMTQIRHNIKLLAMKLRALESELLRKAYAGLQAQQRVLADSDTVKQYLAGFAGEEDDFT